MPTFTFKTHHPKTDAALRAKLPSRDIEHQTKGSQLPTDVARDWGGEGGLTEKPDARLAAVLSRLRTYAASGRRLSDSAMRSTKEGLSIINALAHFRRRGVLAGGASPLADGARAAGLSLAPAQEAHEIERIVTELYERVASGQPSAPVDLSNDAIWRKRYAAIRRHKDWDADVVMPLLAKHPELCVPAGGGVPLAFLLYARQPDSRSFLAALGRPLPPTSPPDDMLSEAGLVERGAWAIEVFRDVCLCGERWPRRTELQRHPVGGRLHSWFKNRDARRPPHSEPLYHLVEHRLGLGGAGVRRSGAKQWPSTTHDTQWGWRTRTQVGHPMLQSPLERLVDDALGFALGPERWAARHSHGVSLGDVVAGAPRRFSIDVVVWSPNGTPIATLEIGGGELSYRPTYRRNRALKAEYLKGAGVMQLVWDHVSGRQRSLEALELCVVEIGKLVGVDTTLAQAHQAVAEAFRADPGQGVTLGVDELRGFVRSSGIRRQKDYLAERTRLLERGDPLGAMLPSLQKRRFDRAGATWTEIAGTNERSATDRYRRLQDSALTFYASYGECREAARRLRLRSARDYQRGRRADPRLPGDPHLRFPAEFAADGWPAFLGYGGSVAELSGLVAGTHVFTALRIDHRRWRRLIEAGEIVAAATRPRSRGSELYFRIEDVMDLAQRCLGMDRATPTGRALHTKLGSLAQPSVGRPVAPEANQSAEDP